MFLIKNVLIKLKRKMKQKTNQHHAFLHVITLL